MRRELINIGEDVVNVAYRLADRLGAARADRGRRAPALSDRRKRQVRRRLPAVFRCAEARGRHGRQGLRARRPFERHRDRARRPRPQDGRAAGLRPHHHRRPPGHGQDRARHQHRLQHRASAYRGEVKADGTTETVNGGIVGFFSLEMSSEQLATRIIAEQSGVASYKIRRGDITEQEFHLVSQAMREMQSIPFYIDQTGGISIAQLTARARRLKRQRGLDVLVVDYLQLLSGAKIASRKPRAGTDGNHHRPESARQGAQRADPRPVAALAPGRTARRQAPATLGPARIRLDRTGRRRRAVRLSRGILPEEQGAAPRHRRAHRNGWPRWSARTAAPK